MKKAKLLIVGGPISVGKSTLISSIDLKYVPEINELDELQNFILENTYKKDRVSPETIENYFLQIRKQKYKMYSNKKDFYVLDRSIFESLIFAKENMSPKSFEHFQKLWKSEIKELISDFGKPYLYILLTMNWKTFKKRFFKRGRKVEIDNFKKNKLFFKKHIKEYEKKMIWVFNTFNIKYIKIKTDNLNSEEVKKVTLPFIKEFLDER